MTISSINSCVPHYIKEAKSKDAQADPEIIYDMLRSFPLKYLNKVDKPAWEPVNRRRIDSRLKM